MCRRLVVPAETFQNHENMFLFFRRQLIFGFELEAGEEAADPMIMCVCVEREEEEMNLFVVLNKHGHGASLVGRHRHRGAIVIAAGYNSDWL